MSVHTEWAAATAPVELLTADDDWSDQHGQRIDAGKVGLAFDEIVVEGTREELAAFARRILDLVAEPDSEKPDV